MWEGQVVMSGGGREGMVCACTHPRRGSASHRIHGRGRPSCTQDTAEASLAPVLDSTIAWALSPENVGKKPYKKEDGAGGWMDGTKTKEHGLTVFDVVECNAGHVAHPSNRKDRAHGFSMWMRQPAF